VQADLPGGLLDTYLKLFGVRQYACVELLVEYMSENATLIENFLSKCSQAKGFGDGRDWTGMMADHLFGLVQRLRHQIVGADTSVKHRITVIRSFTLLTKRMAAAGYLNEHADKFMLLMRTCAMALRVDIGYVHWSQTQLNTAVADAIHTVLQVTPTLVELLPELMPDLVTAAGVVRADTWTYLFDTCAHRIRTHAYWTHMCYVCTYNSQHDTVLTPLHTYAQRELAVVADGATLLHRLQWCIDLLQLHHSQLAALAVVKLANILTSRECQLYVYDKVVGGGDVNRRTLLSNLVHQLLLATHRTHVSAVHVNVLTCLGALGAIEPVRLAPAVTTERDCRPPTVLFGDFSSSSSNRTVAIDFAVDMLRRQYRAFISMTSAKQHDICCYTIQETFKALGITKAISEQPTSSAQDLTVPQAIYA
jgi:hypothetical protein